MSAEGVKAKLASASFIRSKEVVVVPNALKLPGFEHALDSDQLNGSGVLLYLMTDYEGKVTLRRHDANWQVSKNH